MTKRWPAVAMFAFFIATAIVHALVASWTPWSNDDWGHQLWAAQHRGGAVEVLADHWQLGPLVGYALARSVAIHVLLASVAFVTLIVGVFVLAFRRLPQTTWDDVLALVLASALLWIGQSRPGYVWFARDDLATDVCGCALAVWFLVPLRCTWRIRPAWGLALMIAGFAIGTSTRQIALATLVGAIAWTARIPRSDRTWWSRLALGGLVLGTIAGFASPPWPEIGKLGSHGLDTVLGALNGGLASGTKLVSLVVVIIIAERVLRARGTSGAPEAERPNIDDTWWWLLAMLVIALAAPWGPRYREATLLPATVAGAVGALPILMWFGRAKPLRVGLILVVVAVHAVTWSIALSKYATLGREFHERIATLQRAPRATTPTIRPYSQIDPDAWFDGEELASASARQLYAIELLGLRDIQIAPGFPRYERNPGLALRLDASGVSLPLVTAAKPPHIWASELTVARQQFERFAWRLAAMSARAAEARLLLDFDFAERRERPLVVAWMEHGAPIVPSVKRAPLEPGLPFSVTVKLDHLDRFKEAWLITNGKATAVTLDRGQLHVPAGTHDLAVLVVCEPERCVVVDAVVPLT